MTVLAGVIFILNFFVTLPHLMLTQAKIELTAQSATHQEGSTTESITTTQPISTTDQLPAEPYSADFYLRVAARSIGEGSFAIAEIACTIKNRLRVSRASLAVVLRAYHARDVKPRDDQVEVVRQIFAGELPCPPTWWYALSLQDTRRWKPHPEPAIVVKRDNHYQVWIFDR